MPLINVWYSTPAPKEGLVPKIAAEIQRLSHDVLGKDRQVTAVVIEEVAPTNWFVAGPSLAEQKLASFGLEFRVTQGTNTKDEIGAFIAQAFAAMAAVLGPLHEESYVHVIEAHGYAYGYGGQTQEKRSIAAQLRG